MWFSWGLKGAFAFFGAVIFITILAVLFTKWMEFVDKHIKDENFIEDFKKYMKEE